MIIIKISSYIRQCYEERSNGKKRSKRGILQAILLAQALSTRHPENETDDTEETRCHRVPRQRCYNVPVKHVTKHCSQVIIILDY